MCSKRKKLNEWTIEKKKEVLELIAKGVGQRAIAVQFGVAKLTIGNIGKNRAAMLKEWEENCDSERKRKLRKTDNTAVNIIMLQFFFKYHAMNIPVTRPMLQSKPKEIAQRLHIENFQASNGWHQLESMSNSMQNTYP
jgi:hypothetical protein